MNEHERIQQLVDEGKITQEEADLLHQALDEVDAVEEELSTLTEMSPEAAPPTAPEPPRAEATRAEASRDIRWLRISMMAKNLEITTDPGLKEPQVRGANLERQGDDWVIEARSLDSLLSGQSHLEIRLPSRYGVDLSSHAGNVEVSGAAHFKGRVVAGNVELSEVEGIDLELKAGNLEATLRLSEGNHRVLIAMGNADITLLPGSDVRVQARAHLGRAEIEGPSQLGEGRATLEVAVKMGNVELEVPHE